MMQHICMHELTVHCITYSFRRKIAGDMKMANVLHPEVTCLANVDSNPMQTLDNCILMTAAWQALAAVQVFGARTINVSHN